MFYRLFPDKAGDKRFYPREADLPTPSADGLLRVIRVTLAVGGPLPVYPDKQTFSESVGMSQRANFGSERTHSIASSAQASNAEW